jgi:hypothetical protein
MARAMGQERCVPIRGNGAACCGMSLRETVFVSYGMKEHADLLLRRLPLGKAKYLTLGEIDQARAVVLSDAAGPHLGLPFGAGGLRRALTGAMGDPPVSASLVIEKGQAAVTQ